MKILLILFLILLTGCSKDNKIYVNIEYGSINSLFNLVNDKNIIVPDIEIKGNKLGKQIIKYKTKKNNKIVNNTLVVNVVDTTKPILQVQSTYYTEINKNFDLKSKLFFGDNYDRRLNIRFIGSYDVTKEGTYPIKIVVSDSSGNVTEKNTNIVVQKKQSSNNNTKFYNFNDFKMIIKIIWLV